MSVSVFAEPEETAREVTAVRERLPHDVELWVGGAGATTLKKLPSGILLLATLDDLDRALTELAD